MTSTTYQSFMLGIQQLLEDAKRQAARSVNVILTATYWEIGRRIFRFEQRGQSRALYGEELIRSLSQDLTERFGRGFGFTQIKTMRQFYLAYPEERIGRSLIGQSAGGKKSQSLIDQSDISKVFPLSWTHYVRILRIQNPNAREFYETEALRGGWAIRQLDRQINSQFYERTALSKNKAAMLLKGSKPKASDTVTPEEEIKNPYVLEFLGLKDEYSENELEEALIHHLETFLLELGGDFAFVARQRRLRVGARWYRVDLVFYHRRLRCLVLIDLKLGELTHADAGQMHLYLNYAREHWTHTDENPPVGLILCAEKDCEVAKYALEGLPNKVLASEYRTALPKEQKLIEEIKRERLLIERARKLGKSET